MKLEYPVIDGHIDELIVLKENDKYPELSAKVTFSGYVTKEYGSVPLFQKVHFFHQSVDGRISELIAHHNECNGGFLLDKVSLLLYYIDHVRNMAKGEK